MMSIRRGSMLIIAAVPISALAALPMYSLAGLSRAAEYGVYIKNTASLENTGDLASVIYDKADVFTDGTPKLVSPACRIHCIFIRAALCCADSQRIQWRYNHLIYIRFQGYSGLWNGNFASWKIRFARNRRTVRRKGNIHPGHRAKKLTLKEKLNPYAESVISDFAALGGIKSVLLTEDGRDVSERLAKALNVDELHYECGFTEKADIIQKCKDQLAPDEKLMYISAENLEYHTAADIDAKVGTEFENADMLMSNVGIFGLPVAYTASHMVKRLSSENLVFTAVIKFVLVVLALTGSATLWFIVLLDFAASVFGVLNVVRMPSADTLREDSED